MTAFRLRSTGAHSFDRCASFDVARSAGLAGDLRRYVRLIGIQLELHAAPAHPARLFSWNADNERVGRNILCHDAARADERVLTERSTADDRCVRADRGAPLDERAPVLALPRHVTSRIHDIRENH